MPWRHVRHIPLEMSDKYIVVIFDQRIEHAVGMQMFPQQAGGHLLDLDRIDESAQGIRQAHAEGIAGSGCPHRSFGARGLRCHPGALGSVLRHQDLFRSPVMRHSPMQCQHLPQRAGGRQRDKQLGTHINAVIGSDLAGSAAIECNIIDHHHCPAAQCGNQFRAEIIHRSRGAGHTGDALGGPVATNKGSSVGGVNLGIQHARNAKSLAKQFDCRRNDVIW